MTDHSRRNLTASGKRIKAALLKRLFAGAMTRAELLRTDIASESYLDRVLREWRRRGVVQSDRGLYVLTEEGRQSLPAEISALPETTPQPMPRRGQLNAVERERDAEARELDPDAPRVKFVFSAPARMVLRVEQWDAVNGRLSDQPPELLPVLALALRTDGRCVAMVPGRRGTVVPCDDPVDGPLAIDGAFGTVELAST